MARQVLTRPGTPIRFNAMGPGPSGDVMHSSLPGLPAGSGSVSEPRDFGIGPRPLQYTWRMRHQLEVRSTYESVNCYLVTSDDGIWWDANVGSGDRVLPNAQTLTRDMQYVGACAVNVDYSSPSGTSTTIVTSGMVNIPTRYAAVAIWNDTTSTLGSGVFDNEFILTALPDEVQ